MALQPERPRTDPLLGTVAGPSDDDVSSSRAPVGNSILTLMLVGGLAVVGIAIWWLQRPNDLTDEIGAREWTVIAVDGEPVATEDGRSSTFVLDGTFEVRAMERCGTAVGSWQFDTNGQQLDIDWDSRPADDCPSEPSTDSGLDAGLDTGRVSVDGDVLRVESADTEVRAVSIDDLDVADADEIAGRWSSGSSVIEFGQRGLLRVDDCTGSWIAAGRGIDVRFDAASTGDCDLAPIWTSGAILLPARFEDSLFVSRDVPSFPLDRHVHRLDRTSDADSPLLDGP